MRNSVRRIYGNIVTLLERDGCNQEFFLCSWFFCALFNSCFCIISICFFRVRFWAIVPANVLGLRFGFIINTLPLFGNVLFARGFRQSRYALPHEVYTVGNGYPQL